MIGGSSQKDEASVIDSIFNTLNIQTGYFIEVGVNSPRTSAGKLECNTVHLRNKGWTGKWIDGKFKHPLVTNMWVYPNNVEKIFENTQDQIDLFSYDTDTHDWQIVRNILRLKKDIKVFCVETNNYNNTVWTDEVLREDKPHPLETKSKHDAFGGSCYAFYQLFRHYNYSLVATSEQSINGFYVKDEYAHLFQNANEYEKLYKPLTGKAKWSRRDKNRSTLLTTAKELLKDE